MNDLLKELYYNPSSGFIGANKLYIKAKAIDAKITMNKVNEFLQKQATAQITKEVKHNKTYNSIISPSIHNNYQIDLMDLPEPKQNNGFKYLLTCIDIYSRKVDIEPIKTKTGDTVLKAFKSIIHRMGLCKNLNCDLGSEFIYIPFKRYCDDNNIIVWYSNPEESNKNAIIERFHRTLRNMILKYTVANGKSYINILPQLIMNYNTSYHITIDAIPNEIWNGDDINHQVIHKIHTKFVIGNLVRHLINKKTFDKHSSTPTYTKTIYTITKISGNSLYLDDLKKPFRDFELIIAVGNDMNNEYDKQTKEHIKLNKVKRKIRSEGIDDYLTAGKYYR